MFPLVTDLPGYQVVTSLGLFRVFRVDVVNVFCMAQFLETESINCLLFYLDHHFLLCICGHRD